MTSNLTAVGSAVIAGIVLMCATTWFVWSLGLATSNSLVGVVPPDIGGYHLRLRGGVDARQ